MKTRYEEEEEKIIKVFNKRTNDVPTHLLGDKGTKEQIERYKNKEIIANSNKATLAPEALIMGEDVKKLESVVITKAKALNNAKQYAYSVIEGSRRRAETLLEAGKYEELKLFLFYCYRHNADTKAEEVLELFESLPRLLEEQREMELETEKETE